MDDDEPDDWRHWAVLTIAEDMPEAFPGGPSHKAGTRAYFGTITRDRLGRTVGFSMPSPTALALNISIQAARRAETLRGRLRFNKGFSPYGPSLHVPNGSASDLYDFFEQSMLAATFALNALEIFCNQTIADVLKDGTTYSRTIGKRHREFDAAEAQRGISIEEKLGDVLPRLLVIASPRTNHGIWSGFSTLKRVRNSTIHMKAEDAYKSEPLDGQSLFHEFFVARSVLTFPINSIEMLTALQRPGVPEPLWLQAARRLIRLPAAR